MGGRFFDMLDFSKNYFELFGLPVDFKVDADALAGHYRELQRVIHPDRYANASEQERRLSLQAASLVNEAYETLKDPIARAAYLLTLHGIDLNAKQKTTQDMAFLMQQMELREELAEIRTRPDPYAAILELSGRIGRQIKDLIGEMASQLESVTPAKLEVALELLHKMRFLQKLRGEAETVEAELEDELE
ncbi:MAG: co-chaperone HscB [Chromatiales bacterium]